MMAVAQNMNLLTDLFTRVINRGIWCKVRSRKFWRTCRANWDNGDYLNNVRVDLKTFWYLVEKLRPSLERQKTNMRQEPMEVDEIIAIVLWCLGSGDSSGTIAWMFGVGVSTVRQLVTEVAEVIIGQLGNKHLGEPTTAELLRQAHLFETTRGFPMAAELGVWIG